MPTLRSATDDDQAMQTVHLLDYVAGNVRSLANAIEKLGYTIEWIQHPQDVQQAEVGGHQLFLQAVEVVDTRPIETCRAESDMGFT